MSSNRKRTTIKSKGAKRSRRAREGMQEIVWVYFKPAEKKAIESAAAHKGVSMSELVASAVLREVGTDLASVNGHSEASRINPASKHPGKTPKTKKLPKRKKR